MYILGKNTIYCVFLNLYFTSNTNIPYSGYYTSSILCAISAIWLICCTDCVMQNWQNIISNNKIIYYH